MSVELISLDKIEQLAHQYGYWVVFLGIAIENTGIPLPGETITIVGGFLAGSGELNYWLVLTSSILGAVLGDNFGYWIGKFAGWQFLVRIGHLFRIQEYQLEIAKERYSKNAAQAVLFGRFITLLRIFAGPLAGISEMSYRQFLLCNFVGATIWAATIISLSFFLGKIVSLEQIISWVSQVGLWALVAVIVAVVISFAWRYSQKRLLSKE